MLLEDKFVTRVNFPLGAVQNRAARPHLATLCAAVDIVATKKSLALYEL